MCMACCPLIYSMSNATTLNLAFLEHIRTIDLNSSLSLIVPYHGNFGSNANLRHHIGIISLFRWRRTKIVNVKEQKFMQLHL